MHIVIPHRLAFSFYASPRQQLARLFAFARVHPPFHGHSPDLARVPWCPGGYPKRPGHHLKEAAQAAGVPAGCPALTAPTPLA